jgi:hypothetical protein
MFLCPFRNPLLKTWYKVTRRVPKGHGTWVHAPPLTPTLSPLEKRGEGVGSGRMCRGFPNGKRDILSVPAPQGEDAGSWYRLKIKAVPGNGITSLKLSKV